MCVGYKKREKKEGFFISTAMIRKVVLRSKSSASFFVFVNCMRMLCGGLVGKLTS